MNGSDETSELDPEERTRLTKMTLYEEEAYRQGYRMVAGIDEAGRGPLAGPVVAAICVLPRGKLIAHVDDSKKLTPKKRRLLFDRLTQDPTLFYAIGVVDAAEIDRVNIYQATLLAMGEALKKLSCSPDYLLVDGRGVPASSLPARGIVKGDQLSLSIAAASILAKETRDCLMREYHQQWPLYGFDQHKGYGTAQHLEAVERYGPCPIHRHSFDPIKHWIYKNPEVLVSLIEGIKDAEEELLKNYLDKNIS